MPEKQTSSGLRIKQAVWIGVVFGILCVVYKPALAALIPWICAALCLPIWLAAWRFSSIGSAIGRDTRALANGTLTKDSHIVRFNSSGVVKIQFLTNHTIVIALALALASVLAGLDVAFLALGIGGIFLGIPALFVSIMRMNLITKKFQQQIAAHSEFIQKKLLSQ